MVTARADSELFLGDDCEYEDTPFVSPEQLESSPKVPGVGHLIIIGTFGIGIDQYTF